MAGAPEEEEWNEYREKLKDYSVLKIDSVRLVDSIDTEVTRINYTNYSSFLY